MWSRAVRDQIDWFTLDRTVRLIRGSKYLLTAKKREEYMHKRAADSIKLRDLYDFDRILRGEYEYVREFRDAAWRMTICGNDFNGNPIVYVPLGQHKWGSVKTEKWGEEFPKYLAYHQECLSMAVWFKTRNATPPVLPQYALIFDLKGLSWTMFYDGFKHMTPIVELWSTLYPETVNRIYVVNAPLVFQACMKLVTPFIEPDTLLKIRVGGGKYEDLFAKDKIPLESLPKAVRGRRPDDGEWILPPNPEWMASHHIQGGRG